MLLINNYHTHTSRCGHATGTDEEYVINAIKAGIKVLGFSDHIPFPEIDQPGVRMGMDKLDDYIESINYLKDKYKDQITIYVGFEAEYFPFNHQYYLDMLKRVDYLICGQHFNLGKNELIYVPYVKDDKAAVVEYVDNVVKAMESGLFKYIAHPDIIMRSYTLRDDFLLSQIRRICETSERTNTPLEINLEGINRKVSMGDPFAENFYPFPSFWKIVGEYHIDVILGADVHHPEDILKDYDKYGRTIAYMCNLHLIDKIDIK